MAPRKKTVRRSRKSSRASAELMEHLKQYVRTQGPVYLEDKNISSVGIGYKVKNGMATNQLSIQFTVAKKAVPEVLESLNTTEIPKSILVAGVEVPTDVIQRKYERAFRVLAETVGGPRKTRVDPIMPGISASNKSVTAGTIGCIVFDRQNGTPYILSNWHVLQGPRGNIGDEIVQPGPHDDNRVDLNRLGQLVRSHLGAAGDCAVASIEARSYQQDILELDVKAEQLGEPELGDTVVKSGRTTGVTHGTVTRVHTMVKIDYGDPVGEKSIGGFEIGLDQDNLPGNGEISQGGDSGSVWLFKASNGKPTKVMAGLHFAGEGPNDPNEHAIACYARSIFEKLEISLSKPHQVVPSAQSVGYTRNFLGVAIEAPKLSHAQNQDAFSLNGSNRIHYTHFSLALSTLRRFAFWVAWNIDGGRLRKIGRKGLRFKFDSRIPDTFQIGDELYGDNRLDRGHIARRADLVWGSDAEARQANKDSFFFTNIAPQMDNFNQGNLGGIWGRLEDAVFDEVDVENLRVSVFGGPVFRNDDRVFRGTKIPREFFKVLAFVESGQLRAKAFLLTQNLNQLELLDLNQFKVFQVTLTEVEERCGFTFPNNLRSADGFAEHLASRPEAITRRESLDSLADIRW